MLDASTEALENEVCRPIDTIYLKLPKAFNTVHHVRLLHKLDGLGVQGTY